MQEQKEYTEFLKSKIKLAPKDGFELDIELINTNLKPFNKIMVKWLVEGGRRACFASFGLHKTVTQLEAVRLIMEKAGGGKGLIVCPLNVRQEFQQDAINILKWDKAPKFIRRIEETEGDGIYLTNYETIRDGKLNPNHFVCASLDEASILRGLGGSKTFREFMRLFTGDGGPMGCRRGEDQIKYRFVATATPSPNEYIELLAYADFLGVMDVSQAKAQPVDAKLLTKKGWINMCDVRVGENIISVDGSETTVLGIYPQGLRDCYKVTFDDGFSTECDIEHLWETQTQYQRNAHGKFKKGTGRISENRKNIDSDYYSVKTTKDIINSLGYKNGLNHTIPNVSPVEFEAQPITIDPYLLGVLLGDGYLRDANVLFSSMDDFIIEQVKERIPEGLVVKKVANCDYHICNQNGRGTRNILVKKLREYQLTGKKSETKFIPEQYLFNSIDVRIDLLRGLMDTDGTVCKSDGASFTSCSVQLADGVCFLVQSLGGIARKRKVKTTGMDAYKIKITLPKEINPFLLPRKAEKVKEKKRFGLRRAIRSIELIGQKEMQCIAISHPRRLYVTDNFIVTHNTRFFKRDSTHADKLTLHAHKEEEFWLWVSSWAMFVTRPSDITGEEKDDEGYILPDLDLRWHEIPSDHSKAGTDKRGQFQMFNDASSGGLQGAAKEKRESLDDRISKMLEIRNDDIEAHRIIWHDLESERHAIEKAIPDVVSIFGSQDYEKREDAILDFTYGRFRELAAKPVIAGSGCNFQRHCSWAIYLGIGFKFNDFIQSIHRLQRFLQQNKVRVDLIYTEAERGVRKSLEKKWSNHIKLVKNMTEIIKKYGLSHSEMAKALTRKIGVERVVIESKSFLIINNDNVDELSNHNAIKDNSVGLILTSIPFSTQYEYSPNYADFGHSESNAEFFQQMDYLTPNIFRKLMPGRIAAIHVKDRIVPMGLSGMGCQTVYPFHVDCIQHYTKHGFAFIGMKTIVTDVVRENNQTYRLGWTEQCKDGTKMGVGMPEYLLYFRKPQTDTTNAYADIPVVKLKKDYKKAKGDWINPGGYSRARWQIDAHGFTRSSGERCLTPDEYRALDPAQIFQTFKRETLDSIYNFEHHVKIGETLEAIGKLPSGFMLLQPQSWSDEVWTDITRMLTLNGSQWSKGKEMHLCPMQFDIADRVIDQLSNTGDIVLDPFGGLMTVPYRAILKHRLGIGIELNPQYFLDGAAYCRAAEQNVNMPTLFNFVEHEEAI